MTSRPIHKSERVRSRYDSSLFSGGQRSGRAGSDRGIEESKVRGEEGNVVLLYYLVLDQVLGEGRESNHAVDEIGDELGI